jgi:hypothetical protein
MCRRENAEPTAPQASCSNSGDGNQRFAGLELWRWPSPRGWCCPRPSVPSGTDGSDLQDLVHIDGNHHAWPQNGQNVNVSGRRQILFSRRSRRRPGGGTLGLLGRPVAGDAVRAQPSKYCLKWSEMTTAAVIHLAESMASNVHYAAVVPKWIYLFLLKHDLIAAVLR